MRFALQRRKLHRCRFPRLLRAIRCSCRRRNCNYPKSPPAAPSTYSISLQQRDKTNERCEHNRDLIDI